MVKPVAGSRAPAVLDLAGDRNTSKGSGAELTPRQQNILDFVSEFTGQHGFPPSIREIGEFFGIRSTNGVSDHLRALERKGFLQRSGHLSRSLQVVRDESDDAPRSQAVVRAPTASNEVRVPILGRIAAGQPQLAVEQADDALVIDAWMLGGHKEVFGLRVVGESMIEAGILPGDFLFVRRRATAAPGEIVVAMVDGEATVKRWFPEGDRIRLQPENRHMQPIYVRKQDFRPVDLLGTVVGIYRKLV
jgi:repressor LexA